MRTQGKISRQVSIISGTVVQDNHSVPLINKEGVGEVLLEKPSSTSIFQRGM